MNDDLAGIQGVSPDRHAGYRVQVAVVRLLRQYLRGKRNGQNRYEKGKNCRIDSFHFYMRVLVLALCFIESFAH